MSNGPLPAPSEEPAATRLVADAMLGRLARWLRILGYDTLYDPAWDDAELVRIARAEDRLLLTRDTGLAQRHGARIVLVPGETLRAQLAGLRALRVLAPPNPWTRCPHCNGALVPLAKDRTWGVVPSYVFLQVDAFQACSQCSRVYWRGTHWLHMREALGETLSG